MKMTREEKAVAIAKRFGNDALIKNQYTLSCVMIAKVLMELEKEGILQSRVALSKGSGKNLSALCEEFDWDVDDMEIKNFLAAELTTNPQSEKDIFFALIKARLMKYKAYELESH